MSPEKQEPKVCNWCDQSTEIKGHRIDENGRVVACPSLDMVVQGDALGGMR